MVERTCERLATSICSTVVDENKDRVENNVRKHREYKGRKLTTINTNKKIINININYKNLPLESLHYYVRAA